MGLIDVIRRMSEKKSISKQKFKTAQEDLRIQQLLEERQKSSNRRELERYMHEQEEAKIKQTLDSIRKKQQSETWSGKNTLINQKMNIMKNDNPILKQKNIFLDNKTKIPLTGDNLFFKW